VETKLVPLHAIDESDLFRLRLPPYRDVPALADDLKAQGQLAPLFVRPRDQRYELISGYRRLTALKLIAATTAFCRIFRDISDARAYDIAITENEERNDLSVLERAQICLRLQSEGKTADEIACRFGWTNRRNVYHHYRLAKDASAALREAMQAGGLSLHVALALIDTKAAALGEALEREILRSVVENEMSVREARNHVARVRRARDGDAGNDGSSSRPSFIRDHKNGAFTISARIDPSQPEALNDAIASVESALKRMKHLRKKLDSKNDEDTGPATRAEPKLEP
jgi:ParB/RepB/Spo0J family partition protein